MLLKMKCLSAMADDVERDKKLRDVGTLEYTLREYVRLKDQRILLTKRPRGHTIHQGHQGCAGERGPSINKEFRGRFLLQARTDDKKGSHEAKLLTSMRITGTQNNREQVAALNARTRDTTNTIMTSKVRGAAVA